MMGKNVSLHLISFYTPIMVCARRAQFKRPLYDVLVFVMQDWHRESEKVGCHAAVHCGRCRTTMRQALNVFCRPPKHWQCLRRTLHSWWHAAAAACDSRCEAGKRWGPRSGE